MKRHILECSKLRLLLLEDFLPSQLVNELTLTTIKHNAEFHKAVTTLNDPEYTNVRYGPLVEPFAELFRMTIQAGWRDLLLALRMDAFRPTLWNMRVAAMRSGAYKKPRAEAMHANWPTRISALYRYEKDPADEGGEIRVFDHDPYLYRQVKFRTTLDFTLPANSMILFSSEIFYAIDEIVLAGDTSRKPAFLAEIGIA